MKPQIISGIIFGTLNLVTNIALVKFAPGVQLSMIFTSGLLFFDILFAELFFKKYNNYSLTYSEGLKCAVQAGIVHSVFCYVSYLLIQTYIMPGFFPSIDGIFQYLMLFNMNIILFSIFSLIFGLIVTGFLYNKKVK